MAETNPMVSRRAGHPGIRRIGGVSFWLPILWLVLVMIAAGMAHRLPMPAYDHMNWEYPAALPGTPSQKSVPYGDRQLQERPYTYWLGTDTMGRDIVSRLIFGARTSLAVGLLTPLIGLLLGGTLGLLAGFYRGRLESVVVAGMDIVLAFPGIVLLLAITFLLGPGLWNLIIALGFLSTPAFCRVARAGTLVYAEREFVQAARLSGARDVTIMVREILPNIGASLMVYALMVVAFMIVIEGAMSFLGLGVPPPTPSWGGMISEGREVLDEAPHVSMVPALVMFLTVLSFNLIGDHLRTWRDAREARL